MQCITVTISKTLPGLRIPCLRLMALLYIYYKHSINNKLLCLSKGLRPRTDPEFLIRFLRARKFDQERAFELILGFYRMRQKNATLFTGLKPSDVRHVYESAISFPHKLRDRQGRLVYLMFPGKWIERTDLQING